MKTKNSLSSRILSAFQRLGKALMLPIAVLPVAGIFNRIGAADLLNIPFIQDAGAVIFDNLPLIFAIGIAVGLAKNHDGAAALAGGISYFILGIVAQDVNYCLQLGTVYAQGVKYTELVNAGVLTQIDMSYFHGFASGIIAGVCYNKFKDTKLPDWLQFFGGRRFVPIITGGVSVLTGGLLGIIWPYFQKSLDTLSLWLTASGAIGQFFYGLLNRLLIPFGLHHILNTYVWFNYGTYTNDMGKVFSGDITRFLNGDPTAGTFLAGFFPIMMFALPAAALAMYVCAHKKNKPLVGGMLFSVAFTAFLTGITEPIEFMFMFLSPVLYAIHAVLTGISLVVCNIFGILDGFSFSAGLFDYVLNWGIATKPYLLIPIGLAFSVVYFFLFVFFIKKFNLPTPGRESDSNDNKENKESKISKIKSNEDLSELAKKYVQALGGKENIKELESCITRLRMVLDSNKNIDEAEIKKLGAAGILKAGESVTQVIVGTKAELIAEEMKKLI